MRKVLCLALCAVLLFNAVGALALIDNEKEQAWTNACSELYSYLEEADTSVTAAARLSGIADTFEKLGNHNHSQSLYYYTCVLISIDEEQYSNWRIDVYLDQLSKDTGFANFIENSGVPIGSAQVLNAYYQGRKAEHAGDVKTAIDYYDQCIGFFDASSRRINLQESIYEDLYQRGEELMDQGNLEGAYRYFIQCPHYKEADIIADFILTTLGYDPLHEHEWQPATCTTPKTCSICGVVEGEAPGHKWDSGTVMTPATCISKGVMTYTCMVCGDKQTECIEIDAGNHVNAGVDGKINATCGTEGFSGNTFCSDCGKQIGWGDIIPATGNHDWQDATYDAPKTCRVCGKTEGEPLPRVKVGDYITYGHYPQTASGTDNTPIEWLVLEYDEKNNRVLLISRYGLDCQKYNSSNTSVTWETCSLRTWLNGTFLNKAFSKAEQGAILTTEVDNSKSQCYSGYSTNGGNNTKDKIFLLSYAEANKYFKVTYNDSKNTKSRVAPTEYAVKQGASTSSSDKTADGSASGYWWLRSPGFNQGYAAFVLTYGSLYRCLVNNDNLSVRPAFWLDLSGI